MWKVSNPGKSDTFIRPDSTQSRVVPTEAEYRSIFHTDSFSKYSLQVHAKLRKLVYNAYIEIINQYNTHLNKRLWT